MTPYRDLLTRGYDAFNRRDIDAALAGMHPEVKWPNGLDGGYVHGHAAVRDYWTRQWAMIDPHVEPRHFEIDDTGRVVVTVHQVVRDLTRKVQLDQMVRHVYQIEDNLARSMEIQKL